MKRDHKMAIAQLLQTVGAVYKLFGSDELAKELENKREPEIRRILLKRWKQIKQRKNETCKT